MKELVRDVFRYARVDAITLVLSVFVLISGTVFMFLSAKAIAEQRKISQYLNRPAPIIVQPQEEPKRPSQEPLKPIF